MTEKSKIESDTTMRLNQMVVRGPMTDPIVRKMVTVCIMGIGVFLLWSGFAPLAEGVMTSGHVVVEDNRKVVQHLEGGLIRTLHVREGEYVTKGALLVELDQIASLSQRDELAGELATQQASLARLSALSGNVEAIDYSALELIPISESKKQEIMRRQSALFRQQREAHRADIMVLQARQETIKSRERDTLMQLKATQRAKMAAGEELKLKRAFLKEGIETIYNVQRLEREFATIQADQARLRADIEEARVTALEIEQQILQVIAWFDEKLTAESVDAKRAAVSVEQRLEASSDILQRTAIRAPQSGVIMNMRFATVGGVIKPGEAVMEIVPEESKLVAEVKLRPSDIDAVHKGMRVKAHLSAYKAWRAPPLVGEVISISADLKTEPDTGRLYYEARILIDAKRLQDRGDVTIIPGMPVDAFIDSGFRHSFLDLMVEPIVKTIKRGIQMG